MKYQRYQKFAARMFFCIVPALLIGLLIGFVLNPGLGWVFGIAIFLFGIDVTTQPDNEKDKKL